ncbi:MAG: hypothetical protein E7453_01340 [Ruminococcaceae bacterium]|nr:hypothetical protein [Oscillospiraceae bacterium]
MKQKNYTKILSFVLAVLLVCLLITQLLPFWNCSNCKTHKENDRMISIAEYILFPLDHKSLTSDMTNVYKAVYGEDLFDAQGKKWVFTVDEILICPLLVLVGCLLGIVLCIVMENKLYGILCGAIAGIAGVMGYLLYLPLQIGPNWQIHLAVAGVTAVASIALLVYDIIVRIKAIRAKK